MRFAVGDVDCDRRLDLDHAARVITCPLFHARGEGKERELLR